jgi:hypothetical protein
MERIKVITSHAGLARWLAETSEEPIGFLARADVADIPSPYAYSPTKAIYDWNGRAVVWFETKHKRYEVFAVPAELRRFATDEEATEAHIEATKPPVVTHETAYGRTVPLSFPIKCF